MELFNKLEDVISFVLTGYGKEQLATGTFNPVYYSFSDSDVIYDTAYYTTPQGASTPMSASQNRPIEDLEAKVRPKPATFPDTSDNDFGDNFFKVGLLGTSEFGNNLYPAFEVKLHSARISGSSYVTGTYLNESVPTINLNILCKYDQEGMLFKSHETCFLEITELNGLFEKENFEYSLYRRYDPILRTGPTPLFLYRADEQLEFIDIYETEEVDNVDALFMEYKPITSDKVEYWFDIDVDEKINEELDFNNLMGENIYLRPENVEVRPENC